MTGVAKQGSFKLTTNVTGLFMWKRTETGHCRHAIGRNDTLSLCGLPSLRLTTIVAKPAKDMVFACERCSGKLVRAVEIVTWGVDPRDLPGKLSRGVRRVLKFGKKRLSA